MEHANLFSRLLTILDEVERIDKEHPIDSSVEPHPQISQLTLEARHIIAELNPVISVIYRDRENPCEELDALFESIEERNLGHERPEPNESTQQEETDPQAEEMISQGDTLASEKLDPIDREAVRDDLEELAEWERHMETHYNLDKKDPRRV